jgi:hypothetical protein
MPKFRYVGNRRETDGTQALFYFDIDGKRQSVGLNGVAELSESQYLSMSELFVLTRIEEDKDKKGPIVVKNTNRTVAKPTDRA